MEKPVAVFLAVVAWLVAVYLALAALSATYAALREHIAAAFRTPDEG